MATEQSGPSVDVVELARNPEVYEWIDPGNGTGWAVWNTVDGFNSGQGTAYEVERMLYWQLKHSYPWVHLGWELYLITPGHSIDEDGSALKVIGFLEWVTRHFPCDVLTPQPSSARNLGSSGGKLRALGWHRPGKRHANAAAEHLLAYLLRAGKLPSELLEKLLPEVNA